MTQHNLKNSFVPAGLSKAHVTAGSVARDNDDLSDPTDYQSVSDLDTQLAAKGAPYNSQAYLDSLTLNDKIFALKLIDDSTNYGMV